MFKMTIPVLVDSVSEAKEGAKCAGYADLLFTGGYKNLSLKKDFFDLLKDREGDQVNCVFKMRVAQMTDRFKKTVIAFEPAEIIEITEEGV